MAEKFTHNELEPLKCDQLCIGIKNFSGQEAGDLPFTVGERLWIVKPCEQLYWYIARNGKGKTGVVPFNFLKPVNEGASMSSELGSISRNSSIQQDSGPKDEGYIHMNPKEAKPEPPDMVEMAEKREQKRRLKAGTLVVGTHVFEAQKETDLGFGVYEEMLILSPLPDLCWYQAQKTDQPEKKGAIPITHVRLVYMSEEEDEVPSSSQEAGIDDRLYDDMNDFISQSGWFSYPGLPHSKEALHRVLAKKCIMPFTDFMACKEAVYKFDYTNGEKVFVGKARVLHVELSRHFDNFDRKSHSIRAIDDELCHHTNMGGWDLTVWPIQEGEDLEFECAKKIIELDCLCSNGEQNEDSERKITNQIEFTSKESFDKFWNWFCPST